MSSGGRSLRTTKTMRGKTTTATVRTMNLGRRGPAGLADPVSPPNPETFARFIKQGICPWCGRGPFDVLALHTNRQHSIDRKELREVAGVYYSESLTSAAYHQRRSDIAKRLHAEGKTGIGPMAKGTRKSLSPAARQLQREKSLKMTPERRAELGRQLSERRLAAVQQRDDEIVADLAERLTYAEIGRKHSIDPRTVRTILRRRGIEDDGRARYAASASRSEVSRAALTKGRQTRNDNLRERSDRLVEAWQAGTPIRELAEMFDVSLKTMRARLKALGQIVPDGRSDPLRPKPKRRARPTRYCTVDGCDGVHLARGLCSAHYQASKRARA